MLNCTVERAKNERGQEDGFWPTVMWTRDGQPLDFRDQNSESLLAWPGVGGGGVVCVGMDCDANFHDPEFATDFRVSADHRALMFLVRIRNVQAMWDSGVYACLGDGMVGATRIVSLPSISSLAPAPSRFCCFPSTQYYWLFSLCISLAPFFFLQIIK